MHDAIPLYLTTEVGIITLSFKDEVSKDRLGANCIDDPGFT